MANAKVYKNFINGEWVDSVTGKTFDNRNPADTRELLGEFPASNEEDVKRAIDAAKEAYKKWRLVPAPRRGEMLFKRAEILLNRKEDWSRQMPQEMAKLLKETRVYI